MTNIEKVADCFLSLSGVVFWGVLLGSIFFGKSSSPRHDPPPPRPEPPTQNDAGGPYCPDCGREVEVMHSHKGHRIHVCPKCGPVNLCVVGREGK